MNTGTSFHQRNLSNRLTCCLIVLLLSFSSMVVLANAENASATIPTSVELSSESWEKLWLNTFEYDDVGEMPIGSHPARAVPTNASMTIESESGNQYLVAECSGIMSNTWMVSMYTGHKVCGEVNFTFDIRMVGGSSVAGNGALRIWCHGEDHPTQRTYVDIIRNNATSGQVRKAPSYAAIDDGTWYHVALHIQPDLELVSVYINDVLAYSFTQTTADLVYSQVWVYMYQNTQADRTYEVDIDNIGVYVPCDQIRTAVSSDSDERALVSFIWDDFSPNVITDIKPYFDEVGAQAGVGVVVDWVGGYAPNWTVIQSLADDGWEIVSHSVTHPVMTGLTVSQATYEFVKSKEWIEANLTGVTVKGFIYVGHQRESWLDQIGWEVYDYLGGSWNTLADIPYMDMYRLNVQNQGMAYNVSLTAIIYGYNNHVNICGHGIGTNDYAISEANWTYFWNKLQQSDPAIVLPSEGAMARRNAQYAILDTSDSEQVTITYPEDRCNFTRDSVWIRSESGVVYGEGTHVLGVGYTYSRLQTGTNTHVMSVTDSSRMTVEVTEINVDADGHGEVFLSWWSSGGTSTSYTVYGLDNDTTYAVYQDGVRIASIPSGSSIYEFDVDENAEYEILVWAPYESMSMVFAIVPLILIASVIPLIIGLGRKLK